MNPATRNPPAPAGGSFVDRALHSRYSARGPRRHKVSVVFLGRADITFLKAGDASAAELVADWRHAQMAFDHQKILRDAWRLYAGEGRRGSV